MTHQASKQTTAIWFIKKKIKW